MTDQYTLVRRRGPSAQIDVALGWHVSKFQSGEVDWHNGGTGGYRTFFGFDPLRRLGVVVLTNAATPAGGDDIGFHLLAGRPLQVLDPPKPPRKAIQLTPAQFTPLVGTYQITPKLQMTVTQNGSHLMAQITVQRAAEIFPETPTEFFWRIVDAQASFRLGPDGKAAVVVIHQGGRDTSWNRAAP
jgi:D-alanyl-D-alanine-carboxypeptidase/D-alanyl-D-alanine-endopeptidase